MVRLLFVFIILGYPLLAQSDPIGKSFFKEANAALKKDRCAEAVVLYDSALAHESHEFYHYQKGLALRACKKPVEARQAFLAAIAINPRFAHGYLGLANQYYDDREFEQAMNCYVKALGEKKDFAPALAGLALSQTQLSVQCMDEKRWSDAVAFARKSLDTDSLQRLPHLVLATSYNRLGKYRSARDEARIAIAQLADVKQGAAWFELGLAEKGLSNTEAARVAFTKAKSFDAFRVAAERELAPATPQNPAPGR